MPRLDEIRDEVLRLLENHYGSSSPFAAAVDTDDSSLFGRLARVALGRVATPKMAAAAYVALRDVGMLEPKALAEANPLELDDILKQARVALALKSLRPVQKLARWFVEQGGEAVAQRSTAAIREEWREINGIGLSSADALLLQGLGRLSYPVDRATFRILVRHGWLDSTAEYDEARELVERLARHRLADLEPTNGVSLVEEDAVRLLSQLSRWFEQIGREFCKPTQARCEACPLRPCLPPGGPVEVE